jgi:leucyl aminopeptidase (aminopeptidase T)
MENDRDPRGGLLMHRSDYVVSAAEIFEACRVRADEKVTIYADTGRETEVVEAFLAAAQVRGADPTALRVPARKPLVEPPKAAVEAMAASDFVLDLASQSWLYTPATTTILRGGTRMLQVLMPSENILRKKPRPEIAKRARFAESLFEGETTVRIASSDGSELHASFEGRAPAAQDGVVLESGEWDSLGTAFVNVCPIEGSVEGKIALNSTVYLAGGPSFIVDSPIEVTLRKGRIAEVQGGGDSDRFWSWLESYHDPNLGVVAHLGFGYDELSGPPPLSERERDWVSWEAMHGGVIVAFGANTINVEFHRGKGTVGGKNVSRSHADCTVLGADFSVGTTKVLEKGNFQFKELMREA